MGHKVFANHAHVFEEAVRPHGTIERLKALMAEAGIDKAVTFAPISGGPRAQMSEPDKNPNVWLAGAIKGDADLYGFGTIDFSKENLREQTEQIADLGLRGIKLHPAYQQFKVNGERAYQVYEAAERCGLFLSFHTGVHWHRLSDYTMLLFDDLTYDFPNLKFSMEHIGGYCFFKEAVAVIANRRGNAADPHVFAGWTSIYDKGLWYISDAELSAPHYGHVGADLRSGLSISRRAVFQGGYRAYSRSRYLRGWEGADPRQKPRRRAERRPVTRRRQTNHERRAQGRNPLRPCCAGRKR